MGFFSSRKPELVPIPDDASAKVIRSRFYGKHRSGRATPVPTPKPACNQSPAPAGRHAPADALTMSLAQRLNDLAAANADGLLDDEEYRLLRQNLFERFAAGAESPKELPVVPMSSAAGSRDHYHRTPSVNSQRSIATAVSSLFRRATGRYAPSPTTSASASVAGSIFSVQQQMSPAPDRDRDAVSVMSTHSRPSFSSAVARSTSFAHSLARRPSDDSLMSSQGSLTNDLRSVISRHRVGPAAQYASSISSRATTRSAKPPSSFHLRHQHPLPHTTPPRPARTHETDDDDDHPKSAAELRTEIESVESEGRKLLDAFNGLELTTLTKPRTAAAGVRGPVPPDGMRRLSIYPESTSASALGSAYTLIPDVSATAARKTAVPLVKQPVNLKRKPSVVGSIAGSIKSAASKSSASDLRAGFISSAQPTLHSARSSPNLASPVSASELRTPTPLPPPPPAPVPKKRPSILRQQRHPAPPMPTPILRPSPLSHRTHSSSNGTDPALHLVELELADIRRRKADVSARYERRLEFLRAKLKAAELRERVSKK